MSDVQMKVERLLELDEVLAQLGHVTQAKLAYAVARNVVSVKAALATFREKVKPTEAMAQFEKDREALLQKHARKDSAGKPIWMPIEEGGRKVRSYDVPDMDALTVDIENLRAESTQMLKEEQEREALRKELLEMPETVSLYTIPFDALREDSDGNLPVAAHMLGLLVGFGIIADAQGEGSPVVPFRGPR